MPSLRVELFRFYRHSCFDPCIESAVKRMHMFPAAFSKFFRHTGARRLVRSSTISYDCAILRYLFEMQIDFRSRHPNRVR
jgi:hypothetical protein